MVDLFDIKRLRIATPEQTYLEFAYAGIGRRLLAALVDMALIGASWVFVGLLAAFISLLATYTSGEGSSFTISFTLTVSIIAFGLVLISPFLFYHLYEFYWHGQTPGKRIVNIQVLRSSGLRLDALSCILRNLVRYLDFLPYSYLLGAWSVVVTPHQQRIGDLVAGTVVIWLGPRVARDRIAVVTRDLARPSIPGAFTPTLRDERLRRMLADYFTRRSSLSDSARKLILRRLARLAGRDPFVPQAELEQALYTHYQRLR